MSHDVFQGNVERPEECLNFNTEKCSEQTSQVFDTILQECIPKNRLKKLTKLSSGSCYDVEADGGFGDYANTRAFMKEEIKDPATQQTLTMQDLHGIGLGYLDVDQIQKDLRDLNQAVGSIASYGFSVPPERMQEFMRRFLLFQQSLPPGTQVMLSIGRG